MYRDPSIQYMLSVKSTVTNLRLTGSPKVALPSSVHFVAITHVVDH